VIVTVNGSARELAAGATVAVVVAEIAGADASGVAVAVNDDVLPRAAWAVTTLAAQDRVEVLTAMQGG
jgi:sulfur carrier protein